MPHRVVGFKEMRTEGCLAHCRPVLNGTASPPTPQPCPYDLYDELKSASRKLVLLLSSGALGLWIAIFFPPFGSILWSH